MLFMCHGVWRDLDEDDQQRMLDVYQTWSPPAGLTIQGQWVTPDGQDFVLVEADSVEVVSEGAANWAPFIDYTIHAIATAEAALPAIARAVAARAKMK